MKAVLLAAGYGTRLRPLTDTLPKCLVPLKGRALLTIWLANLSKAGISDFLINTHHLNEHVEAYVASSPYKNNITLAHESRLLGTAGTLRHNKAFWQKDDSVMVIHADNYCDCDLRPFIKAHQERPAECVMTMMTFRTDRASTCGIVELDDKKIVKFFHEKKPNPPGNLANAAIYICATSWLAELKTENDFSCDVIPQQLGRIFTWENEGVMEDIGTPEAYAKWK